MKYRPVIIAERHSASSMTYIFYCYLKNNPTLVFDYCLFEGALDSQTHLQRAEKSFEIYKILIAEFLKSYDTHKVFSFLETDLKNEYSEFTDFVETQAIQRIDKKLYPYGFGQLRNLSVHYLIYTLLFKQNNVEWIAIDNKRHEIKKIVEQKLLNGTAYLYKSHKNIGQVTSLKQKILLEAAPIRSKYMSNKIFDYACNAKTLVLIGSRHAYDIAYYTPDLGDIFGYNPQNENDNNLYYYNIQVNPMRLDFVNHNTNFTDYCRSVTLYNTTKIKSNFGLNTAYLNILG